MGIIKKIIHILAITFYALILLYSVCCIPLIFKYHPIIVLSGSMEPKYKTGSIIYYKKVPENQLKVGDVITFNSYGRIVTHRIASIKDKLIETKGDANNAADINKIHFENVIGKVASWSIPYLGYYIKIINENITVSVIIVVITLVSEFLISNLENDNIDNERIEENE